MADYPDSAVAMIRDDYKFKAGVKKALEHFKAQKTYCKPDVERLIQMRILVERISTIYAIEPPVLVARDIDGSSSRNSSYSKISNIIVLRGKLSIITLLHELAHAIYGSDERKAVRWSTNLFRQVYPKQYEKLTETGHMLVA